ncbi:hypothetical protein CASFOL_041948 [Castilleja foliolosa]|uniref:Uncharacterized protein n=1 Tax=Castilleja foliolosa TaxID=1961234 RepID=A0ABD3B9D7_9LAMI
MAFSIARSETDVINNRAEGGHVFAAYRREWKRALRRRRRRI